MSVPRRELLLAPLAASLLCCRKKSDSSPHVRIGLGGFGHMIYLPARLIPKLGHDREQGISVKSYPFQADRKRWRRCLAAAWMWFVSLSSTSFT